MPRNDAINTPNGIRVYPSRRPFGTGAWADAFCKFRFDPSDAHRVREDHRRERGVPQEELLGGQRRGNGQQVFYVANDVGAAQAVAGRRPRVRVPVRLAKTRVHRQQTPGGHVAVPSFVPESKRARRPATVRCRIFQSARTDWLKI